MSERNLLRQGNIRNNACFAASALAADTYPSKSVQIIFPIGPSDILAMSALVVVHKMSANLCLVLREFSDNIVQLPRNTILNIKNVKDYVALTCLFENGKA